MNRYPVTAPRTSSIDVGGATLSVTEYEGGGAPLLLLHGIGSDHSSWWPIVDPLASRFRVIAPDWRGHGASEKPEHGYLIEHYANDLAGLVCALELDRPHVMGHSLGGMVALRWASMHRRSARRLVIEDSPLRRHHDVAGLFDGWISLASQPIEMIADHYAREYPHWTADECSRRARTIASTHRNVFIELRDRNLQDDDSDRIAPLASIDVPTLLVHGDVESGGMVEPADADRFGRTVAGSTVVRIPGGSHSLHRDRADEFLAVVTPFLTGT